MRGCGEEEVEWEGGCRWRGGWRLEGVRLSGRSAVPRGCGAWD